MAPVIEKRKSEFEATGTSIGMHNKNLPVTNQNSEAPARNLNLIKKEQSREQNDDDQEKPEKVEEEPELPEPEEVANWYD